MEKEVKKYLGSIPPERASFIQELHTLIIRLYPKAIIDMHYKMPTYHVGEGWVAIANQKQYVSLYTCGYHHIEQFKQKHPTIKTGKGCINFKPNDRLPLADIREVVQHAIEHPKAMSRKDR